MTIEEREKRLKETLPAAIAALTAVINEWAEVTVCEDVIDPVENMKLLEKQAEEMGLALFLMAYSSGIGRQELTMPLAFGLRKAFENTMEAESGRLAKWQDF